MNIYKICLQDSKNTDLIMDTSKSIITSISIDEDSEFSKNTINTTWHKERYGFELSKEEYALHLTHRKAWNRFLESNDDYCCIIEENIYFNFDQEIIENILAMMDKNWDVLFPFDKFEYKSTEQFPGLQLINPNFREAKNYQPFYMGLLWGSQIYFLSKKGVVKLLLNKDIKQRVEDEIFFQSEHYGLETYYDEFEWFKLSEQVDFFPKNRLKNIHNAVLSYNIWKPESLMLAGDILKKISDLACDLSIDLILHGGTLLGYVRHGGIMKWDDDIDIGIEECNITTFCNALKKTDGLTIKLFTEASTKAPYYKIWDKQGVVIEDYEYTFPFIDLWLFRTENMNVYFKNGIIFPNATIEPFEDVIFEEAKFKIPFNSIECLDSMYTDWKSKIRIYAWSHQEEMPILHQLITEICVDSKGRLLL